MDEYPIPLGLMRTWIQITKPTLCKVSYFSQRRFSTDVDERWHQSASFSLSLVNLINGFLQISMKLVLIIKLKIYENVSNIKSNSTNSIVKQFIDFKHFLKYSINNFPLTNLSVVFNTLSSLYYSSSIFLKSYFRFLQWHL